PFDSVPFAVVTMVEGVLSTWAADPAPDRSRAQVVDELATITWFVLDGAARTSGIHVDPDRELTSVLREFTEAGAAGS
ncbi:TetR/AcrR family transcriptional regulator, partial [Nocardia sp. NPDC059180]